MLEEDSAIVLNLNENLSSSLFHLRKALVIPADYIGLIFTEVTKFLEQYKFGSFIVRLR